MTADLRYDEVFLNTQVGVRHSLYSTKLPSHTCQHVLPLYVAHSKIRGSVTSVFSQAISSTISYPESSGVCSAGKHPERLVYGLHFPRKRGFPVSSPVLEIRMKVSDCLIIAG